jgi:hypothetical protein
LYCSPNIIRVIKSRGMGGARHVACIKILVVKPEGKTPLGRPRHRGGITLEWILGK